MPGESLQLERFVFDTRFAEAFDAATAAEKLGVVLAPIAGDLMEFWYDELDLRWKQGPMTLAGVTTEEALFVLETFAQDRGMRVVFRGRHGVVSAGEMTHSLSGPRTMLDALAQDIPAAGWANALGEALTAYPLDAREMSERELTSTIEGISLRDVPLFSWLIAPRSANVQAVL
jgi:hypothetical protein